MSQIVEAICSHCKHVCNYAGSTAVADDMNDHLVVLEHPVPVGPSVDAHRGLVGANDPRATQPGQDHRHFIIETGLGTTEHASNAPSLIRRANRCRNIRASR